MKRELFGMRRANGDWFVSEGSGSMRVVVFRDLAAAWRTRALNPELMLFWPTPIDERALTEFATADQGHPVGFWLIDEEEDPEADLKRGHPLEYMQVATIERLSELPFKTRAQMRGQAAGN